MGSQQKRLRAIELTLTPLQIVVLWLSNSIGAGTLEDGARQSPSPRDAVAMAAGDMVRNCTKGQSEPLIKRAVLQARQEADFLYMIVADVNIAVCENHLTRAREFILLRGFLRSVNQTLRKETLEELRPGVLMFLNAVLVLDGAIRQVAAERFDYRTILFPDSESKLKRQIRSAEGFLTCFNAMARLVGASEINLENVRSGLQSNIGEEVSVWVNSARIQMLSSFGEKKEFRNALEAFWAP
jgi:hypothetical protein